MRGRLSIIGVLGGLIGVLIGCGGGAKGVSPKDGYLYVVNNTNFWNNIGAAGEEHISIEWEGQEIIILRNMNDEGKATSLGSVQITPEPLAGGTPIEFVVFYKPTFEKSRFKLSQMLLQSGEEAIIDGDITIEIYSARWAVPSMVEPLTYAYARVIRGKFDGIYPYPELSGGS